MAHSTTDIFSQYHYYVYQNLIQSLQLRKKGSLNLLPENNGTMLLWGPSVFIGGEFSEENGIKVVSELKNSAFPRWIYYPDETWRSFLTSTFSDKLNDKYLHVYQSDSAGAAPFSGRDRCIVEVTRDFIEKNLPNTETVTEELYSYTDTEDFYRNGFGLALVIDGTVSGYCLSEYSIRGSHGINVWVDEPYRRRGYAGKMVNAFLNHCRDRQQTVWWVCNSDNIPSNKTAVSSGFVLKAAMHYFEL